MNKFLTAIIMLVALSGTANGAIFGLMTQDDYQLLKAEIGKVETNLNESLIDIETKLEAQIDAQSNLNAQVGALNTNLTNKLSAGRDASSTVNDPSLYKYITIILGISILGNIFLIFMVIYTNSKKRIAEYYSKEVMDSIKFDPNMVKE